MHQHLTGTHHVSIVTGHIARTHEFYTRVLGMRTLIKTVNQNAPTMYHLFYGDGVGSPGSDLTFFDIPGAMPERRGNYSVTRTTLRVAGEDTFAYWQARFDEFNVRHAPLQTRDSRRVLDFEDYEGTQLSLIDDGGQDAAYPWSESPVPAAFQIRGLGYTMLTVPTLAPTERFLVQGLGLQHSHVYPAPDAPQFEAHVFTIGDGGAHAEVHVVVRDDLPSARHGAGGVHHVALRVPEGDDIGNWEDHLSTLGYRNSGIVDRHYFTSVYVREPNHVLFELATDGPGFAVDRPLDGELLSLPPFLESQRAQIESQLRPLETALR